MIRSFKNIENCVNMRPNINLYKKLYLQLYSNLNSKWWTKYHTLMILIYLQMIKM